MAPMATGEPWTALGDFIRSQRQLARLSLRQLAELTSVSNPYLSQIERGLYRPSAQVLKSIAEALHMSAETMYAEAGLLDQRVEDEVGAPRVEQAIPPDHPLSPDPKEPPIQTYT